MSNASDSGFDVSFDPVQFLPPLVMSVYLNACFLTGEIIVVALPIKKQTRKRMSAAADVLIGPISVLAFFEPDFTATFLFFLTIWHFLVENTRTRVSYVMLRPRSCSAIEWLRWLQSLWLLIHHIGMCTVKLAFDMGIVEDIEWPTLLMLFMQGGGVSHLSYAMSEYGFKGVRTVRVLSVVLRMGSATAIVVLTGQVQTTWKWLMIFDLGWMAMQLLIAVCTSLVICRAQQIGATHGPSSLTENERARITTATHLQATTTKAPVRNIARTSVKNLIAAANAQQLDRNNELINKLSAPPSFKPDQASCSDDSNGVHFAPLPLSATSCTNSGSSTSSYNGTAPIKV